MLVDTVLGIRDQINREKMLCNNSPDGLTFRSHLWKSSNVPFHAVYGGFPRRLGCSLGSKMKEYI